MERSRDVGLMKALGGPVERIMHLFLAEAAALGVVGGSIGFTIGAMLARWIWRTRLRCCHFAALAVFPVTIALAVAVALTGALPLRLLGRVRRRKFCGENDGASGPGRKSREAFRTLSALSIT